MSTAIALYDRITDPAEYANKMGKDFYLSGLFGCTNESQGIVLAMACACEGKNPLEIARQYHVTKKGLVMKADAMLAEFRRIGGEYTWIKTGEDGEARIRLKYKTNECEFGFTMAEATAAGLAGKDTWKHYGQDMLCSRAAARGIRKVAPEVSYGYYTPEEIGEVIDGEAVQGGTNGSAKRATVEELLAKSASAPVIVATTGTPASVATATLVEKDVIDVEAEPAAATPTACTAEQSTRIHDLFISLQIAHATQEKVLAKYGAQAVRNLTGEQATALIAKLEAMPAKLPPAETSASDYDIVGGQLLDDLKAEVGKLNDAKEFEVMKKIQAKLGDRKISQLCHRDAEALLQAMKMANFESFFARELVGKNDQPKEFPKAPDAPFDS